MKNGYSGVYDYNTLVMAARLARKILKLYPGIFKRFTEENFIQLQNELIWRTYKISPFVKNGHEWCFDLRDIIIQVALCIVIDIQLISFIGKKELFYKMLDWDIGDIDIFRLINLFLSAFNCRGCNV